MTPARNPEPSRVAERAYSIWEEEGRPHGRDRAHWERAEKELATPAAAPRPTPAVEPGEPPAAKKPVRAARKPVAEGAAAKPPRARKAAAEGEGGAPAAARRAPRARKPTPAP